MIEIPIEEETVVEDLATDASTATEDENVAEVVATTSFAVEASVVVEGTAAAVLPLAAAAKTEATP